MQLFCDGSAEAATLMPLLLISPLFFAYFRYFSASRHYIEMFSISAADIFATSAIILLPLPPC